MMKEGKFPTDSTLTTNIHILKTQINNKSEVHFG